MIKGKIKQQLTKELILSKITEYDVFKYYMRNSFKLNQVCKSPFREDKHPSFIIGNKFGNLTFIDLADTSKKGDCFKFVQLLHYLPNYYDVFSLIDKDFGLGFSYIEYNDNRTNQIIEQYIQPVTEEKKQSIIQVVTRSFNQLELKYWNDFHQDILDLKANNIYAIDKLYFNKELFYLKPTELVFGYYYKPFWKIYFPFGDKKRKWCINNTPITQLEGMNNLDVNQPAFINKSKKDMMVIKKLYPFTCAVQNEGMACFSEDNVSLLKTNSLKQILSFDSDKVGVANSLLITKKFNFDYCNAPRPYLTEGITDWADIAKEKGMKRVEQILIKKQIIKK